MIFLENLSNRYPSLCALVIWEETPYFLPVGFPEEDLPKLTRQHSVMVYSCHSLFLLIPSTGGPALPGAPLRIGIPHQARMETPLPEVHPPDDPDPDLLCPADAQRLRKNNVGKDEGFLGVPTRAKNPLPFHCQ